MSVEQENQGGLCCLLCVGVRGSLVYAFGVTRANVFLFVA